MAITVQNINGSVDSANSYGDAVGMRAYFSERGVTLSQTDEQLSQALVRATDFLDGRYSFVGSQRRAEQGTQCPRFLMTTPQWKAIQTACYLMARRALTSTDLTPDPTRDTSGQAVLEKTVKAGPIETSTKFAEANPGSPDATVPKYTDVDLLLRNARLLGSRNSGDLSRG